MDRPIQALVFLVSHRLDTSRHLVAIFLVTLDHIQHLSFTECFGGKCFVFDFNNGSQTLSKTFLVFPRQVSYTRTRIALANVVYQQCVTGKEEEPRRHFLIYHYIADQSLHLMLLGIVQKVNFQILHQFLSSARNFGGKKRLRFRDIKKHSFFSQQSTKKTKKHIVHLYLKNKC